MQLSKDKDSALGCTLGTLTLPNGWECSTIERPWLNNKVNISSIPAGTYQVALFSGNKYKNVYQVLDVPDRTYILIHVANWSHQLHGCIAVGGKHCLLNNLDAVTGSRAAFAELKEELEACGLSQGFTLTIFNDYE